MVGPAAHCGISVGLLGVPSLSTSLWRLGVGDAVRTP